jgi:hypothetical protein
MNTARACSILGVPANATPSHIKEAWLSEVQKWHPDKNPHPEAAERFIQIQKARDVLTESHHHATQDFTGNCNHDINKALELWWHLRFTNYYDESVRNRYEHMRRMCWAEYRIDTDRMSQNALDSQREAIEREKERKKKQWPLWALGGLLILCVATTVSVFVAILVDRTNGFLAPMAAPLAVVSLRLWCHISERT